MVGHPVLVDRVDGHGSTLRSLTTIIDVSRSAWGGLR